MTWTWVTMMEEPPSTLLQQRWNIFISTISWRNLNNHLRGTRSVSRFCCTSVTSTLNQQTGKKLLFLKQNRKLMLIFSDGVSHPSLRLSAESTNKWRQYSNCGLQGLFYWILFLTSKNWERIEGAIAGLLEVQSKIRRWRTSIAVEYNLKFVANSLEPCSQSIMKLGPETLVIFLLS